MAGPGPRRVLIVDDEEDLAAVLSVRLSAGWGFEVAVARDGEEGALKAETFAPDVVLLDLAMPKVDGWELCRRLRENPRTRGIPLVVMTALVTKGLSERAAEAGARSVLRKPLEESELLEALRAGPGGRAP